MASILVPPRSTPILPFIGKSRALSHALVRADYSRCPARQDAPPRRAEHAPHEIHTLFRQRTRAQIRDGRAARAFAPGALQYLGGRAARRRARDPRRPVSVADRRTGRAARRARDRQALRTDPWSVDRKSTRLNSSHSQISYAVFCLK